MGRKRKGISYKKIIAIYCEGESEKCYLEMLKRKYHSSNVHTEKINISEEGLGGLSLLKKALQKSKRLSKGQKADKVYVVFDRDSIKRDELVQCQSFAKKNEITIIFSSINIEIWILMHFQSVNRSYSAKELNRILSGKDFFNTDYAEFKGNPYDDVLFDRVKTAMLNAESLQKRNSGDWLERDPYTNINKYIPEIFDTEIF